MTPAKAGGSPPSALAEGAARLGKNWDEGLHNGLASFETRPQFRPGAGSLGAPQDEDKALMALRKFLILRRPRKRPSRRTHGADPANPGFLAQPLGSSALRDSGASFDHLV